MKLDLTFTITAVIAVCALISPVLTAIINNRYLYKTKLLELNDKHLDDIIDHKRALFENFIQSAGNAIGTNDYDNQKQLAHDFYIILPYLPDGTTRLFAEFCLAISEINPSDDEMNFELSDMLHERIIPVLRETLNKSITDK
jgi:hypothetical protein